MALTKEQVLDKMKEKDAVVLNVLGEQAYQKSRIKGSFNIPWGGNPDAFVKAVEAKFGRNKFFITHCANYNCMAGPNAAKLLKSKGFRAEDYPGGIEEWVAAGFPAEGSEVKKTAMTK